MCLLSVSSWSWGSIHYDTHWRGMLNRFQNLNCYYFSIKLFNTDSQIKTLRLLLMFTTPYLFIYQNFWIIPEMNIFLMCVTCLLYIFKLTRHFLPRFYWSILTYDLCDVMKISTNYTSCGLCCDVTFSHMYITYVHFIMYLVLHENSEFVSMCENLRLVAKSL